MVLLAAISVADTCSCSSPVAAEQQYACRKYGVSFTAFLSITLHIPSILLPSLIPYKDPLRDDASSNIQQQPCANLWIPLYSCNIQVCLCKAAIGFLCHAATVTRDTTKKTPCMKTVFPILVACFPLQQAGGWPIRSPYWECACARSVNFELTHFHPLYPDTVTLTSYFLISHNWQKHGRHMNVDAEATPVRI